MSGVHWDQAYQTQQQREERNKPSDFALSVVEQIGARDSVLELGCGIGVDAAFFAEKASSVLAVDFAAKPIEASRKLFQHQRNLSFDVVDIANDLSRFKDASFTVVYARRSLHYFDDETTKRVFREIDRILAPGGQLFLECKSSKDPHAGQQAATGDVRHFFSSEELPDLLSGYEIKSQEEPAADFYGYPSVFLSIWARKTGEL